VRLGRHAAAIAAVLVALLCGAGQFYMRSQPGPPVDEAVAWEPYEDLGPPPYEQPILLEFSAEWCMPCRRMQVTTFRDPQFVEILNRWNLRPVRIQEEKFNDSEMQTLLRKYRADGYPTLIVVATDGRYEHVTLNLDTIELGWEIERTVARFESKLFWNDIDAIGRSADGKLQVLNFDTFWYLPVESRVSWRKLPSQEFAAWAAEHLDLVQGVFLKHLEGVEQYRRFDVLQTPTLVVLGPAGREIARFEGMREVQEAPGKIAEIAREQGLDIPDPPRPYHLVRGPP
jgi:thiol-disulfide isomerase/thioredoxin